MKRRQILKLLAEAGFSFAEGGGHTKVYDPQGNFCSVVGRHPEIPERTVNKIEKQTGVQLH